MNAKNDDAPHGDAEKAKDENVSIPFVDQKGMFGTSPIDKELTDEEVEYLTKRTAPRITLTHSRRKTFLYVSLFMIVLFMSRLVYYRTASVTGMIVPPVYGLNETGLLVVCVLLSIVNLFLVPPQERNVRWLTWSVGTALPLIALTLLYTLPPQMIHDHLKFMF